MDHYPTQYHGIREDIYELTGPVEVCKPCTDECEEQEYVDWPCDYVLFR